VIGRLALAPLGVALVTLLLLIVWLVARQESLVFFPDATLRLTPSMLKLDAEEVEIPSAGGAVLHGWWVRGGGRAAIVFFHGNAGNAGDRLDRVKLLVTALRVDVLLADYRGYGRSSGTPTEDGLYADGLAMAAEAARRSDAPDRIVLFGESLGCAVAIETALAKPCAGLILEAPFLSLDAMRRRHYPFLPGFLQRLRFDNAAKISRVAAPKLFAQAERDEVVPPEQTRRLFERAAPPKTYFLIPGASHNDTYLAGGREYLEAWRRFLDQVVPPLPSPPGRGTG
jgi:fermentation-respiration switch protein FrsA (DUF1100 family)